jgi:Mg2+/Co2+ transporter CorB
MLDSLVMFLSAYGVDIIAIAILVVLAAFFIGSKAALTVASRSFVHRHEAVDENRAAMVLRLIERRDRLVGALMIGRVFVTILATAIATGLLVGLFGGKGMVIATVLMTVLLAVFSEALPKSWALAAPERMALAVAPVVAAFVAVVGPVSTFIDAMVRWLLSLFGVRLPEREPALTAHEELRGAVDVMHREGSVVKADRDRLGGVLDLGELEVSDIMRHRTAMRAINADDAPEIAVRTVLESSFTRMPVWRGSTDNIIGVLHAKDLLRALAEPDAEPSRIDIVKIAQKPWFVPDSTNLKDQLNAFLRRKSHFAVVVDEYGEVQGIVTLEDIIEEIVGDIADEHDLEIQGVRQEADGSIVVDGGVPIRDLNRALDWSLPDEEATTIAGLVIHESRSIPEERQAFTFHNKRFIVMKRVKNRITQLRIRPVDDASAAGE